jgi:hypothetical protein
MIASWYALAPPDALHDQAKVADDMIRVAEEIGDRNLLAIAYGCRAVARLSVGDMATYVHDVTLASALSDEMRLPFAQFWTAAGRVTRMLMLGQFHQAELLIAQIRNIGQQGLPHKHADEWVGKHLLMLRREQGRFADCDAFFREFATQNQLADLSSGSDIYWQTMLAFLYWEQGRPEQARELVEQTAAAGIDSVPQDSWWTGNVALLAELCCLLGDRQCAESLYGLLAPHAALIAGLHTQWLWFGSMAHYLGLLATTLSHWDAAAQHFADALSMHQRMGARTFVAHTQYAHADMLVRRGEMADQERALALLAGALNTAEELGMTRLAEDALALKVRVQGILKA